MTSKSPDLLEVANPYSQETFLKVPYESDAEIEAKLERAQRLFEHWRRVPVEERVRVVREGIERFRRAAGDVARDVSMQMGKPLREAAREVETCCERAEYMASIAVESLAAEVLPPKAGFHRRIEHAPLGVVLDIAAWNYPLLIAVNVVVPALLAGNTVLLKHSGRTPLCGLHFERAYGALEPPGLVTSLVLTHADTSRLIADRRVAHTAFTGSVEGGHALYRQAAERFIDVGLELGGKDPAYVAEDSDLEFAVENVVDGACYNAGQSCCAVERVYVHEKVYGSFLDRARGVLERYRLGDPLDEKTTMGPLARCSGVEVMERQVAEALRRGARLLHGGKRLEGHPGNFYLPTLLAGVPREAEAMQEETFGPLVPVAPVAGDAEALERMNDSRYGLTASVWTRDRERAEFFARGLETGTVYQNRCDYLDPALPWTGVRDSGKGSTLSRHGFLHLTRPKSIHFRL